MKKKMSLLLILAMVVTMTVTAPVATFATETAAGSVGTLYGSETTVKAATTTADSVATATFTYTPAWDITAVFRGAEQTEEATGEAVVTVKNATTPITPTNGAYSLSKGVEYTITLVYTLKEGKTLSEASLIAKAQTDTLSVEQDNTVTKTIKNTELWYSFVAGSTGMVFSLKSGADNATASDKVDYAVEVYEENGTTPIGTAKWNSEYKMMFDCPLVLTSGKTYYVRLVPTAEATENVSLVMSTKNIDLSNVDATTSTEKPLTIGETGEDITLYKFQNKTNCNYWYKITPVETKKYELSLNFGTSTYGEATLMLYDSGLDVLLNEYAYVEDINSYFVDLQANNTYYLRLRPEGDMTAATFKATVKRHDCEPSWYVDEDEETLVYACRCGAEDSWKGSCVIDTKNTKFENVEYTGSDLTFTPTFAFEDWDTIDDKEPVIDPTCYYYTIQNSKKEAVTSVKNIGTYTVYINFCKSTYPTNKSSLAGLSKIKKTLKVVPAGTTLKSVTAAKKAFTVKWAKQATKTTGYQIQYSTSSSMKSAKTVTVSKNSTVSKKITGLKAKKKYYVRIRTYKSASGTKYYSPWSAKKSVTTKK